MFVKFIKSGLSYLLGYSAGEVGNLPELQAHELQAAGVVEIIDEPCTLPKGLPGRAVFVKNDFKNIDEIKAIDDLCEIDGIGKGLNKKIQEFINGL